MQLAGANCGICDGVVVVDREGTWCPSCKSVAHRKCLEKSQNKCSTCSEEWHEPQNDFHYIDRCPTCGRSSLKNAACVECGTSLVLETEEEFAKARSELHLLGYVQGFLAAAGIIGALAVASLNLLLGKMIIGMDAGIGAYFAAVVFLPFGMAALVVSFQLLRKSCADLSSAWRMTMV